MLTIMLTLWMIIGLDKMDLENIFKEQRVLTPDEYQFLGYTLNKEFPPFEEGSYETGGLTLPVWTPAYRAETKEQFYVDLGTVLVKTAVAGPRGFFTTLGTILLK